VIKFVSEKNIFCYSVRRPLVYIFILLCTNGSLPELECTYQPAAVSLHPAFTNKSLQQQNLQYDTVNFVAANVYW